MSAGTGVIGRCTTGKYLAAFVFISATDEPGIERCRESLGQWHGTRLTRQLIPNMRHCCKQQKLQVVNMSRKRAKSRQLRSANSGCDNGTSRQWQQILCGKSEERMLKPSSRGYNPSSKTSPR